MDQNELRRLAIAGIEAELERLNALLQELGKSNVPNIPQAVSPTPSKRPPMSAAARKAISRRMKARWAEKRKTQ